MMMIETVTKPYFKYVSEYYLQGSELYSETEQDPVIDATIHAMDNLAFDESGNKLPFSIECSILAQDIDRDRVLLEDLRSGDRRSNQKVVMTVIVFRRVEDRDMYELTGKLD